MKRPMTRNPRLSFHVDLVDDQGTPDAKRIASKRPMTIPCRPTDLLEMQRRGMAVSDADVLAALHGLRLEANDPAIDYLTARVERWAPNPDGRPPLNEPVRLSRLTIGVRVYRWRRVLENRYRLSRRPTSPPLPKRVQRWGIDCLMAPMEAAVRLVALETGLTERKIRKWAREAHAYTGRDTDPADHRRTLR